MMLKNVSIKRKLILINLVTIGVALVLIAVTAVVGQTQMLRQSLLHDLDLQAEIIASNSTAPLAFNDQKTATEILSALRASPNIVYAAIYTPNGVEFSEYKRGNTGARTFQAAMGKEANFISEKRMGVTHPISLSGENSGTVFIESEIDQINSMVLRQTLLVITALLAIFGMVLLLLYKLQKRIINPLLELTWLMRQVSQDKTYSVRARFTGQDEIGLLSHGFNDMLAQIQARDGALAQHRAHLEQEVAQRTAKLTEAQRIAHLGNWEWDIANNTLIWSDEIFRIFGITPQQFDATYEAFLRAVHPEDRQFVDERVREALEQQRPYSIDHRILLPDGTVRHVHEQAEVMRGEDRQAISMTGTVQDITERKLAEKKLRSSNQLLDSIVNNIPNMIFLKRASDLRFALFNRAGEKLVGRSQEELLGRNDYDFFPQDQADFFTAKDREVLKQDGVVDIPEELIETPRGTRVLHTRKLALHDEQGRPQYLLGISEDITERQKYIDGLRKAQQLAEEMAAAKSNFLANMSHEIRTPMNAIIGLSQLALNRQATPEVRGYLEKILNSSDSLMGILNDILDLSKAEAGRIAIEHNHFDLDDVLENLDNLFKVRAEDKHLDFNIEASPDIPRDLVGDALRLQQVLSNLLGNAIKFTEHGKVALKIGVKEIIRGLEITKTPFIENVGAASAAKPKDIAAEAAPANGVSIFPKPLNEQATLLFSVEDTGIGIATEDMDKLFQPFSQVDGSITRRFGGTGLGLSISHSLLQLMGSDIRVESVLGKGTIFSFELVLGIAPHATHGKVAGRKSQREAGALSSELRDRGQPLAGARILVAEDDVINQQVVREFLELSGVTVAFADNGEEALALLDQGAFDAVLMDVHMPVMDGIEATRRIRAQPRFTHLPIIALTADIASEGRENYLASGMDDFVAKPIQPMELIATLTRWVKRGEADATAAEADPSKTTQPVTGSNPDLGSLPGFDLDNIMRMLSGNRQQVMELLLSFMDNAANVPSEIETKAMTGDFHAARGLAHKISGTAANLGARSLYKAAGQLEREFKAGQYDPATFAAFHEEFKRAMSAIAGLRHDRFPLPEQLPSPQPSPQILGRGDERKEQSSILEALKGAALKLDNLLEENDYVTEGPLNDLKANLPSAKLDQFAVLRNHVKSTQYARARQVLRAMVELPGIKES